MNNQDSGNVPK
jgi:hypothetical protein